MEAQFTALYPAQRYHYLRHLIPAEFYDQHLVNSEWFELARRERPGCRPVILHRSGEGRHYSCGPMQSIFLADGEETGNRYSVSIW